MAFIVEWVVWKTSSTKIESANIIALTAKCLALLNTCQYNIHYLTINSLNSYVDFFFAYS